MNETREQPIIMPATALNVADEESAKSEVGSQNETELGKFKNPQALLDAYNSLQSEFTKKCQLLSQLQKDKIDEEKIDNSQKIDENIEKNQEKIENNDENEELSQENLNLFLEQNDEAKQYEEEIKKRFSTKKPSYSPYQVAWADVLLSHIKEGDKTCDPIINQYVLSDEKVRNKVIEDYIISLNKKTTPPIVMSSNSGQRLSEIKPDSPTSLAEAKDIVGKMFS